VTEQEARPERHTIVVDVEANGLDHDKHEAVEVAWWNLDTSERGVFIPPHDVSAVLKHAQIRALQINRYIDRIAEAPQDTDNREALRLWQELAGRTKEWQAQQPVLLSEATEPPPAPVPAMLLGSNPRFDARMLEKVFRKAHRKVEPCHHRLRDISSYAAGALGLSYNPGLHELCERLNITPPDHTAEADVTATGLAYMKLEAMRPEIAKPWDVVS
jgi:DNA polymerase III epsilon subunit-like protein